MNGAQIIDFANYYNRERAGRNVYELDIRYDMNEPVRPRTLADIIPLIRSERQEK